ncbi:MAG: hypothetical protein HRT57_06975 [Crocinitomicaceae bacterium]|nr:hypothetical protein [Crocinitomicaceae bacterium]
MKYLLPLIFVLVSMSTHAQSHKVEWGDLQRVNGRLIYLLPTKNGEFYALRWAGGRVLGSYQVSRHQDLGLVNKGRIKTYANQSIATFEGARIINGKFVVFLSDKSAGKNRLYMQSYSKDLVVDSVPLELASYSLSKGGQRGWFDIRTSSNGKYVGIVWQIPGKRGLRHTYGFNIFDSTLVSVNEGEYPLPFDAKLSTIHEHHISNNGEYFLAVTEYDEPEKKRFFKNKFDYKALHIFHIAEDGLQDFELDFEGKRVDALAMSSDENGIFTITGIYGEKGERSVAGIFHQRLDVKKNIILQEGFEEFEAEFITQGWTDQEKKRADRRVGNGKGEPQLYNYIMRDATLTADGSIVGTMEQYFIQIRSTASGAGGQTSQTYFYYYNDIIAYRINPQGEFEWIEKVRKNQVSANDGGPYSSYESFIDDGKIYFVFNDNIKNYSSEGDFLDDEKIYTANYGKKKNVVAIASIDLETGEKNRETFFDRAKVEALAVPKMFDVDYSNGEMLVYAIWGKKEKIGVIKFKD